MLFLLIILVFNTIICSNSEKIVYMIKNPLGSLNKSKNISKDGSDCLYFTKNKGSLKFLTLDQINKIFDEGSGTWGSLENFFEQLNKNNIKGYKLNSDLIAEGFLEKIAKEIKQALLNEEKNENKGFLIEHGKNKFNLIIPKVELQDKVVFDEKGKLFKKEEGDEKFFYDPNIKAEKEYLLGEDLNLKFPLTNILIINFNKNSKYPDIKEISSILSKNENDLLKEWIKGNISFSEFKKKNEKAPIYLSIKLMDFANYCNKYNIEVKETNPAGQIKKTITDAKETIENLDEAKRDLKSDYPLKSLSGLKDKKLFAFLRKIKEDQEKNKTFNFLVDYLNEKKIEYIFDFLMNSFKDSQELFKAEDKLVELESFVSKVLEYLEKDDKEKLNQLIEKNKRNLSTIMVSTVEDLIDGVKRKSILEELNNNAVNPKAKNRKIAAGVGAGFSIIAVGLLGAYLGSKVKQKQNASTLIIRTLKR